MKITDIKDFVDKSNNIDDKPYRGPGNDFKGRCLQNAYNKALSTVEESTKKYQKIMLTPRGKD